jgi:hypothetical protein
MCVADGSRFCFADRWSLRSWFARPSAERSAFVLSSRNHAQCGRPQHEKRRKVRKKQKLSSEIESFVAFLLRVFVVLDLGRNIECTLASR